MCKADSLSSSTIRQGVRTPDSLHWRMPSVSARASSPPLWLLVLITASGTLGIHVFAPALTVASSSLGAPVSDIQLTISVYAFGLAIGQLVYGPLSDRFGRRPTLLAGLLLFTMAGLAAALATDVWTLVAARLFQALGACAGVALGRAMVRDAAAEGDVASRLALLNLCVAVIPAIAPVLGGIMAAALGWRSILWLLALTGVALIVLGYRLLVETAVPRVVEFRVFKADYLQLLRSPVFLGYTLGGGCATTSVYAFLATLPFILTDTLHRSVSEIGVYYTVLALGVVIGSTLTSRLSRSLGVDSMLRWGSLLGVAAALTFLFVVATDQLGIVTVMAPMFLFTVGNGIASPLALTKATGVNPRLIGSASGLYGCGQQAVGAACTALVTLGSSPAWSVAIVLSIASLAGQAALLAARRWDT